MSSFSLFGCVWCSVDRRDDARLFSLFTSLFSSNRGQLLTHTHPIVVFCASFLDSSNHHCRGFPVKRSDQIPNPWLLHVSHVITIHIHLQSHFCQLRICLTNPYYTLYSKSRKAHDQGFALGINSCMVTGMGKDRIVGMVYKYNKGVKRLAYYQIFPITFGFYHICAQCSPWPHTYLAS